MDTTRTVRNYTNQTKNQSNQTEQSDVTLSRYHDTYIRLLGINLAQSFPITTLSSAAADMISVDNLEAGSELYTIVSRVAEDTFSRLSRSWVEQNAGQNLKAVSGQ